MLVIVMVALMVLVLSMLVILMMMIIMILRVMVRKMVVVLVIITEKIWPLCAQTNKQSIIKKGSMKRVGQTQEAEFSVMLNGL